MLVETVPTSEAAKILGLSPRQFAQRKMRGSLGITQVSRGKPGPRRAGSEATWPTGELQRKAARDAAVQIGVPAVEIKFVDGLYVWVVEAAKRLFRQGADARGTLRPNANGANTILAWIEDGTDLIPRKKGKRQKLPGKEVQYRLNDGSNQIHARRYVHFDRLKEVVATRAAGGLKPGTGRVPTPEARTIAGLGYREFKRWVEDGKQCSRIIGHAAKPVICSNVSGHSVKPYATWLHADMELMRKKLAEKCGEYPTFIIEKDARRRHPELPTTPLKQFLDSCKFLPSNRGIRYHENVLRRHADGRHEFCTVFNPDDLAAIERENKLTIRDSRDRIIGKRQAKPEPSPVIPTLGPKVGAKRKDHNAQDRVDQAVEDWRAGASREWPRRNGLKLFCRARKVPYVAFKRRQAARRQANSRA